MVVGDDTPPYGDSQANDPSEWTEVHIEELIGLPGDGRRIPFHAYVKRFKSSSPDSELFLHDPLRQMLASPGALAKLDGWPSDPGDDQASVDAIHDDPQWHVTTFVANHHRRLSKIYAYALALVGHDGVHLMIYKDAPSTGE